MGEFAKWLLRDEQQELFDYLFALILNGVFVLLIALMLWPLGRLELAWQIARAYWIFWTVVIIVASVVALTYRIFRMDLYSHANAYVITGLVTSGFLQVGWSAFVAPFICNSVSGAPVWTVIILYAVGVVSCWVAAV